MRILYKKTLKLLVDLQGIPDGRAIQFQIFKRAQKSEKKDAMLTETSGVVKRGKGIGFWSPPFGEQKEELPLEEVSEVDEAPKYYFKALIDDQVKESEELEFLFPLNVRLEDIEGMPEKGVEFKITFSDGSFQQSMTDDNGYAVFEKAPAGQFKIELKDDEFIFGQQ